MTKRNKYLRKKELSFKVLKTDGGESYVNQPEIPFLIDV